METENYKGIAEINIKHRKWFANEEVYALFCEAQADYFEANTDSDGHDQPIFNRQQFLEWCGVKKNE